MGSRWDWPLAVALILAMAIAIAICSATTPRATVHWQPAETPAGML